MKKLILLIVFVASTSVMNYSKAQFGLNVNVRLGLPAWIPGGYAESEYYYMPEIDAYYNVRQQQFIYLNNGSWAFSSRLPGMYAGFDLYNSRKIPVYGERPYMNGDMYRERYAQYRRTNYNNYGYHQPAIAYNNYSRSNERSGYERHDNYRNDNRMEERRDNNRYEQPRDDRRSEVHSSGRENNGNNSRENKSNNSRERH